MRRRRSESAVVAAPARPQGRRALRAWEGTWCRSHRVAVPATAALPAPTAHPTHAWAMEGAGSAETADPTGAARVAALHGPHPPRPPVRRFRSPLETGSRPARAPALHPPTLAAFHPFHSPGGEVHIPELQKQKKQHSAGNGKPETCPSGTGPLTEEGGKINVALGGKFGVVLTGTRS
jgi:hypothetical protein